MSESDYILKPLLTPSLEVCDSMPVTKREIVGDTKMSDSKQKGGFPCAFSSIAS